MILSIAADILLLYTLVRQQKMQGMSEQIDELTRAWETERNHYREIEDRRENLAKIRHDMNEHLNIIKELMKRGEYTKVNAMLDTLTEYVASTREKCTAAIRLSMLLWRKMRKSARKTVFPCNMSSIYRNRCKWIPSVSAVFFQPYAQCGDCRTEGKRGCRGVCFAADGGQERRGNLCIRKSSGFGRLSPHHNGKQQDSGKEAPECQKRLWKSDY